MDRPKRQTSIVAPAKPGDYPVCLDEGQALWPAPRGKGAYAAWRAFATHDLTPEIAGLSGFARHVSEAPETAMAVLERVVDRIGLGADAVKTYFHQMPMTLGG